MTRQRPPERVEMITGDPRAFGVTPLSSSAPAPAPAPSPAPSGRSRTWMAVGAVVVVALVVAFVWPRSTRHPLAAATTVTTVTTVTTIIITPSGSTVSATAFPPQIATARPAAPLEGRPAPTSLDLSSIGLRFAVFPLQVPFGTPVSVRLEGDLTLVGPTVAALVWVDRSVDNGWQTAAWVAQAAPGFQVMQNVGTSTDAGPSPDAITIPAGEAFGVNLDGLAAGTYRVCRYVSIAATDVTVPTDNPVYLCAPVVLT